jgi:hypothetical protein
MIFPESKKWLKKMTLLNLSTSMKLQKLLLKREKGDRQENKMINDGC